MLLLLTTWKSGVTHMVGRMRVAAAPGTNALRRAALACYRFLANNTSSATKAWGVPEESTLEVGIVARV